MNIASLSLSHIPHSLSPSHSALRSEEEEPIMSTRVQLDTSEDLANLLREEKRVAQDLSALPLAPIAHFPGSHVQN